MNMKIISLAVILLSLSIVLADDPGLITTGVGIVVNPGGSGSTSTSGNCKGTVTSCGLNGICVDYTGLKYCIDGKIVEITCRYNRPKNSTTSTACKNVNFDLTVKNEDDSEVPINLTLYKLGTNDVVKKLVINGFGSVDTFEEKVDLGIDYDASNLLIKVKDLNLGNLDSTSPDIIIDDNVDPDIPGIEVYTAYKVELPSDFNYSSITLTLKYPDTTVRNERYLTFYRCGSFNFNTNTCNEAWSTIDTVILDYDNRTASVNINSFSVYALGEPEEQTETCEDFGYSDSCSGGETCDVVQATSTLECCDCVSTDTTTISEDESSYSSSSFSDTTTTTILPECVEHKPYVSVSPKSQSGIAGDTLQFDITVKNKDSIDCESREFDFDFEIPEGWIIDYDPIGEIMAGDNEIIEVMVTSLEEAATNQTYQLSVIVFDVETGEESNLVYFECIVNALPETETKDDADQTQSPVTAFISFVAENQFVLILPTTLAVVGSVLWKNYPKLVIKKPSEDSGWINKKPSGDYMRISYYEKPREKTAIKPEPKTNALNNELKQNPRDEKRRKELIEEIRRKALKEDKKIRKIFS